MNQLRTRTLAATLTLALAGVLTGCSSHTALTVQADLVPFLGAANTQATVPYTAGTVTLLLPPNSSDPSGGALIDLTSLGVPSSASSAVDGLSLDLAANLTPTSDIGAGTATLYVADASATDVFQAQYAVASVAIPALAASQTGAVAASFAIDATSHAAALTRIQSGSFRIGVAVQGSASAPGQLQIDVTRLLVGISLPPGFGLP